ncbi:MAG: type I-MYXAN CRISPR-associated Cas8a1/Cmx1 [Deltaproteobacteria bacterium]|nr:type I-MYXAN CRISPR-associated Cas8a1/Cmx1 [Deltaproteobacteria bacterium]
MADKSLTLGLFDPGMTQLHRVGLAGLYMTLERLDAKKYAEHGSWELEPTRVHLRWNEKPKTLFEPLLAEAFGVSPEGAIQFAAHRGHPMGQAQRLLVHSAVLSTFLQHGQTRELGDSSVSLTVTFDDKQVVHTLKPLRRYTHQDASNLVTPGGGLKSSIKLKGWAFPGGGVRHVAHGDATLISAEPNRFLALLFAPAASLYFLISRKTREGKKDKRHSAALVLPHITNLKRYSEDFARYLESQAKRLYASSLGDAGLMGLASLQLLQGNDMLGVLPVDSCTILSLGTVGWSPKQKTRTAVDHIRRVDRGRLRLFDNALRLLDNRVVVKDDGGYWVATSPSRGLIADNVAAGKPWFEGFSQLMQSKKMAGILSFDRKGLSDMIQQTPWSNEEDKLFVEAVHNALRNRYGALAGRAKARGEAPQFGREFERIRTSLMRAKNRDTLRAEIADLFARGGINKVLQGGWEKVLGLFTGENWQRARDLALLGLASYAGKGVEEIEATDNETDEEDEA